MGLVNAVYSWGSVKALHYTVFSMNLAGLLALLLAIVWAVRFERGFGDYLNLVTPGDGHVWTTVIIAAAVLCSPAYILGVKSWLSLRLEPARGDLEDQPKADAGVDPQDVNRLLFFHVVACLLSGFLVAVLNATYLVLLSGFQQKSRDGLIEAMEKYGTDVNVKARLDAVQTELECCGDNGYEDWFRVPWIKLSMEGLEEANKGPRLEGQSAPEEQEEESSTTADVPFSCCSNDIPKPCVHHDILNPSAVYNYNPKRLTIATLGCRSKIVKRGETIRIFLAGYLAMLSIYQVALSFLARLLQTAHSNEFYTGPEKTRYNVWIFFSPISQDDPLIRRSRRERARRDLRKASNQELSSSSVTESSNQEEEEVNVSRKPSRARSSSAKILKNIRSKISSVKAKSLPLIRPARIFSNKFRSKRKPVDTSGDDTEDEEVERRRSKRPASRKARSEVKVYRDERSTSSSSDRSSATNLPSPPPPPPFVTTLKLEDEEQPPKIDVSRLTRPKSNTRSSLYENIVTNQNSGRRVKVLEKFGQLWKDSRQRESGGADRSNSSGEKSGNSEKPARPELTSTDVYDRFRGSLQHTLARRDAVRARRSVGKLYVPKANEDAKRGSVLERLRCNNVPPSYRLLANIDARRRPAFQPHPEPPPPPPPPPAVNSPFGSRTTAGKQQGQCSICSRPVQLDRRLGSKPSRSLGPNDFFQR